MGAEYLWDDSPGGLALRLYPSGRKAWTIYYRAGGRSRWYTLGDAGAVPLAAARKRARSILARVAEGADPSAERQEERQTGTVAELVALYLKKHAVKKRSGADDAQRARKFLIPALGQRPALSIRRADIARLHRRVAEEHSGPLANRVLGLASSIFGWGERSGTLPEGHANPAKGVRKARETARERFLTHDEARRLLLAVNEEPNPWLKGLVWLLALTGCRRDELRTLRWEAVDLEGRMLRLDATKSGKRQHVPLSDEATAILASLPREAGSEYVFPGQRPGKPLRNLAKPWARICERARLHDIHLHDLRRTAGSWLVQGGTPLYTVGALLRHQNLETTERYARLGQGETREAVGSLGRELVEVAGQPSLTLPSDSGSPPTDTPPKRRSPRARDSTAPDSAHGGTAE